MREIDPYASYNSVSTLPTLEMMAAHALELFPILEEAPGPASMERHL